MRSLQLQRSQDRGLSSEGSTVVKVWVTKDHRQIPIRDMTDSHLLNTIHMIRRKVAVARREGLHILMTDGLLMSDPIIEYLLTDGPYQSLDRERRRRGLFGIHTGDCIWAKSDNDDHSFMSRECYAKQLAENRAKSLRGLEL